ncbi:MAG: RNA polymerase factor sigma-32 [Myxococcales bacterium]|nr:RNA polymerase factor sigma-32 [Myxococcales bacterium]
MALGSGSRRPPAAGRSRKAKAQPAAASEDERDEDAAEAEPKDDADGDGEAEPKDEGDADPDDKFLAEAGAVIDVGDEEVGDDDEVFKAIEAKQKGDDRVALIKRDPMQAYMQEVRRYPLLTPDEEHALATRLVEHGDSTAARKLIEANLRLVVKIAYEYRRAHKNLLDLVQEGNIGLMQAVRKYDPYRGVKLSSYAAFWIRAYILKFILNNWRLVKIGTTQAQRKLFFNLRKERERLEHLGFEPTTKLLAENLQVSEKDVDEMDRRLAAPEASLDAPMPGDDDGSRSRLDFLPSEDARPDQAVAQGEFAALLRGKLETFAATLEGREQTIFRERWLTESPLTLQELGERYGVSRERARQLEKRMLGRLRKYLEAEFGTAVDIDALSRE